jgi:hypothetical protein
VLVAAGQPQPTPRNLPIFGLALLAQFAFDFTSTALRDRLGLGVSPLSLLRFMIWIWAVDLALTPIAVVASLGTRSHPWLIVATLPLIGLLAYFRSRATGPHRPRARAQSRVPRHRAAAG